jgi:hypothetical protein
MVRDRFSKQRTQLDDDVAKPSVARAVLDCFAARRAAIINV